VTPPDPSERYRDVEIRLHAKQEELVEMKETLERAEKNLKAVRKIAAIKVRYGACSFFEVCVKCSEN
jgi:hypothetical protein